MENRQIGWSQEAILLYGVSKQLERLAGLIAAGGGGGGGAVTSVTFTGISGSASLTAGVLNIPNYTANLTYTAFPTNGVITNTLGTGVTILLANGTNAGLLAPADFTKIQTAVTTAGTQTLTNKTIDKRVISDATATGTITINADITDIYRLTSPIVTSGLNFPAPTTAVARKHGQMILITLKGSGTQQPLNFSFGANNEFFGTVEFPLPQLTVVNKTMRLLFQWNDDAAPAPGQRWELISIVNSL